MEKNTQGRSWIRRFFAVAYWKVAFWYGVIVLVGIIGTTDNTYIVAGWSAVIGSLIYRSAKGRRFGETRLSILRKVGEGVGVILIASMVFANPSANILDPVPNIIIPAWAIGAYLFVILCDRSLLRKL